MHEMPFVFNQKTFLDVSHQLLLLLTTKGWKQKQMSAATLLLWLLQEKKCSNPQCSPSF